MKKLSLKVKCLAIVMVVLLNVVLFVVPTSAASVTSGFDGLNWADARDNYVNGWVIPSGLTASETYSSASTIADKVLTGFQNNMGSNTVRLPINEPSVLESWWGVYTGSIDKTLNKGMKVIIAYWPWHNGKPDDMTRFWSMWTTVINKYGGNSNVYFEIMNEPYGYSETDWKNLAAN